MFYEYDSETFCKTVKKNYSKPNKWKKPVKKSNGWYSFKKEKFQKTVWIFLVCLFFAKFFASIDSSWQEDGGVKALETWPLLFEAPFFVLSFSLPLVRADEDCGAFCSVANFCSSWSIFFDWSMFCVFNPTISSLVWFRSLARFLSLTLIMAIFSSWFLLLLLVCVLISSIFSQNSASNWFNRDAKPTGSPGRAY